MSSTHEGSDQRPVDLDALTTFISDEIHTLLQKVKFAPENIWNAEIIAHRVCMTVEKFLHPDRDGEQERTASCDEFLSVFRPEPTTTQLRESYIKAAKAYCDKTYGIDDSKRLLWAVDGVCRTVHGQAARPEGREAQMFQKGP
nr:hypothetical protein B0A51_01453 [Rachicladosporium sp. CCFEE 5018]